MFKSIETISTIDLHEKFRIIDTDFVDDTVTIIHAEYNKTFETSSRVRAIIECYENRNIDVVPALYQYLMYLYNEFRGSWSIELLLKDEFSNNPYYNDLIKYTKKMNILL